MEWGFKNMNTIYNTVFTFVASWLILQLLSRNKLGCRCMSHPYNFKEYSTVPVVKEVFYSQDLHA
jgi:hypothetical protein